MVGIGAERRGQLLQAPVAPLVMENDRLNGIEVWLAMQIVGVTAVWLLPTAQPSSEETIEILFKCKPVRLSPAAGD